MRRLPPISRSKQKLVSCTISSSHSNTSGIFGISFIKEQSADDMHLVSRQRVSGARGNPHPTAWGVPEAIAIETRQ